MKMVSNVFSCNEDCIDIEIGPPPSFCFSIVHHTPTPPKDHEFEFQMSISQNKEPMTSPADELFYKGKLLPLHRPPRLQMVQKLLHGTHSTSDDSAEAGFEERSGSSREPSVNVPVPMQSCIILESRRHSWDLNPSERVMRRSTEATGFSETLNKHKRVCSLGKRLMASRTYLKSLFTKSGPSGANKKPFGQTDRVSLRISETVKTNIDGDMFEEGVNSHRRSFSGAIKGYSATKHSCSCSSSSSSGSSSSSFSFGSKSFNYELQSPHRSTGANSEIESSIEGAIAHCKQSYSFKRK